MAGEVDFTQTCLDVIGGAGFTPDGSEHFSRPIPEGKRGQFELVTRDENPHLDIHVLILPGQGWREEPMRSYYEGRYSFNGMLRYERGVRHVGEQHQAEITVISNHLALSAVQRLLHLPSEVAYEFVEGEAGTADEEGKFGAHLWIPGLKRMQVLTADRRHWGQRAKDLDIGDDALGRLVRPVSMRQGIQAGAAELHEEFREAFEAGERPDAAKRFAGAEEEISHESAHIARHLYDEVEKALKPQYQFKVSRFINKLAAKSREEANRQSEGRLDYFTDQAVELGLADGPETQKRKLALLYRTIAGNAALMFLRSELERPRRDAAPEATEQRQYALEEIVKAFPQKS